LRLKLSVFAFTLFLLSGVDIQAERGNVSLVNRPPVISVPDSQWVAEGDRLFFQVTATDPDTTDILELSYSLEGGGSPPQGCQFEQRQIERGTFTELKGTPGMLLLNYRLIGIDGETGEVYSTVTISSAGDTLMPGSGYYVIAHDNSVQNYNLINNNVDWQNANGSGDNILLLNASGDTLDALGYGPTDTSGWFFCGEGSPATDVAFNYSLGRYPDGTDTDDNSVDFSPYAVPTPGVGNSSPKSPSHKSTLVINEVCYETSDYYQEGSFNWQPDYTEGGIYKFVFVVEDNGSPQLADTGEVVVTVTESAPDTVITLENYATLGQEDISIPVYLANPCHFLRGFRVNVKCEALQFDSVDFVSSCVENFKKWYQFNDDSTMVNVEGGYTQEDTATIVSGPDRKLFCTLLGHPRDCAQSSPLLFTSFYGDDCEFVDTLGVNTYYPEKLNGELVITDSRPDTFYLANRAVSPGDSTEIPVYITNPDHALDSLYVELQMPIPWGMEVNFSRIDTAGTCVGNFNYFEYGVLNWPNFRLAFFEAKASGAAPLSSSSGKKLLFNVIVTADTTVSEDTTLAVAFTNSSTFLSDGLCTYQPFLIDGSVSVGSGPTFIRGDYSGDGALFTNDPLMELQWIFGVPGSTPPGCMDAADYNDDGSTFTNDPLMALQYVFGVPGSVPPPAPYPECGMDPTEDGLDCVWHPFCMGGKGAVVYKPPASAKDAENKLVVREVTAVDGEMRVPVDLTLSEVVCGFDISLGYDVSSLQFKEVVGGDGYDFYAVDTREDGIVRIGGVPDIEMAELMGAGTHRVGEILFTVEKKADMGLSWKNVEVYGSNVQPLSVEWVVKTGADLPTEFALSQNYPNPFNPTTLIKYELPLDCQVRLDIYNVVGQRVATLVDGEQSPGYKTATWNAQHLASGVYFYKLTAGDFTSIRKMLLLK